MLATNQIQPKQVAILEEKSNKNTPEKRNILGNKIVNMFMAKSDNLYCSGHWCGRYKSEKESAKQGC